jgi:circadian clock protein KaiC
MMVRLFDSLKMRQSTGFMTYLTRAARVEETDIGISSLIDTWLEVRDLEMNGERTRGLYVIKSRGMPHSNQVREFVIASNGIHLLDVYPGPDGILTGSARVTQDAKRAEGERALVLASKRADSLLAQKKRALEAQIAALQAAFTLESEAIRQEIGDRRELAVREDDQRRAISERRSNGLTARPKKKGR